MKNDAIGVFDSGLGGLTAVKELNAILPHESENHVGLYRVQAPQLCDQKEQAKQPGTD